MAGFYNSGERKYRPGVYMRIVNRGAYAAQAEVSAPVAPAPPELTDEMIVSYRAGVVTLTLPEGSTVSYDGAGTVTISGLTEAVTYEDGTVTIGG